MRAGLNRRSVRRGFTLLEVVLAIVIVGTGITAAMQLFVTTTQQNQAAVGMTVAMNLANNLQELMAGAAYSQPKNSVYPDGGVDALGNVTTWGLESGEILSSQNDPTSLDVDDFDGATFNPPIDAGWTTHAELSRYTQRVHVYRVEKANLTKTINTSTDQGVRKVVVEVSYQPNAASAANVVYTASWLRFNDQSGN